MSLDISKQVRLAGQCLEAMLPFCSAAGIETDSDTAYDEWEIIVQAVFTSFVVLPVCDTYGTHDPSSFLRLGFDVEKNRDVISFNNLSRVYFINNFVKGTHGKIYIEALPVVGFEKTNPRELTIESASGFQVERL